MEQLTFKSYQSLARETARYPNLGANLAYPVLGLCGESGEVAEKVKKIFRDNDGWADESRTAELKKELGDVLWYIAALCWELDIEMSEVAQMNINKLRGRSERGKIQGSGDNR